VETPAAIEAIVAMSNGSVCAAQTNGMVERFNGRIAEVVKQTRFKSAYELELTIKQYTDTYNHRIPQRALNHLSPVQALQKWQKNRPDLFVKRVHNQTGLDTYIPE
jgi:transposase InsO family protein